MIHTDPNGQPPDPLARRSPIPPLTHFQGFTQTLGIRVGPFGINIKSVATEMVDATAARLKMAVEEFAALTPRRTR